MQRVETMIFRTKNTESWFVIFVQIVFMGSPFSDSINSAISHARVHSLDQVRHSALHLIPNLLRLVFSSSPAQLQVVPPPLGGFSPGALGRSVAAAIAPLLEQSSKKLKLAAAPGDLAAPKWPGELEVASHSRPVVSLWGLNPL